MTKRTRSRRAASFPPIITFFLALVLPSVGGLLLVTLASGLLGSDGRPATAPLLAGVGAVSWLLGLRWYGLPALGLRGGRPLFAGIGFAVMGWVALLLARIWFVPSLSQLALTSFSQYIYLLVFEAFCVQLWAFGLTFRAAADWRGPLTAVFIGGVLFGLVGFLTFGEAFGAAVGQTFGLPFFVVWGFFYALVRLRTGSLLGAVIVQSIQSLTVWYILVPQPDADLRLFYVVTSLLFLLLIWRLWPKRERDYRV